MSSIPTSPRPVQLVLTTCRVCHGHGQSPAGDDDQPQACHECYGTGQALVCRDVYSDLADDVRLVMQELGDNFARFGHLVDILADVADRIERLPNPPAAA